MATMYPLFFSLLLATVCRTIELGNGTVETQHFASLRNSEIIDAGPSKQENNIPPLGVRGKIIQIASAELGVRETTGRNDGTRVEKYLRYTDLGKGHPWCAAFVSWCYGQAGLSQPRNPWSPALFPKARTYVPSLGARGTSLDAGAGLPTRAPVNQADVFGIYGATARRINHVGLIRDVQGKYLITIEGNSNDRVESRRRHLSTIYALADWVIQ